ncbi:putative diguanylate cyclase YdaM [Calidithermus terrae]|uniref:Putative diguanylate cyclase YdaM n=1 Tax=Calidithermus terrae TaxID=1408545 RepID=A0A399DYC4_9DEIN|nr:GGDEF domain-containing protein [Calidithermus terrae]RIH76393.1 putative diguanylate cyclase YdaM [Calidithermus terrae]
MFRAFLKRFGLWPTVALLTLASVVVSVLMTLALNGWRLDSSGVRIAILVPCIVAPLFSTLQLRLIQQLERIREDLHRLSITDELTQTYNRRHFMHVAERRLAESGQGKGLSILIFDLDDFKLINDRYGHLTGDAVLAEVCRRCVPQLRQEDVFARYGGEEFVLLLPATNRTQALEVAERLRRVVAEHPIEAAGFSIPVTVSMGLASQHGSQQSLDELLNRADDALYQAKQQGKNQVLG